MISRHQKIYILLETFFSFKALCKRCILKYQVNWLCTKIYIQPTLDSLGAFELNRGLSTGSNKFWSMFILFWPCRYRFTCEVIEKATPLSCLWSVATNTLCNQVCFVWKLFNDLRLLDALVYWGEENTINKRELS